MSRNDVPFQPTTLAPTDAGPLIIPDWPDIAFRGFRREAFSILERLRVHPHIEQYRKEKEGIRKDLKEPFKSYRDDLVVNVVLPNRLNLETERHVFSRVLKNDFGAGGCHHHLWLSFYRPERTRLTDVQLAHSIRPSGLRIAVFAGKQAKTAFRDARNRLLRQRGRFLDLVNPLLQGGSYVFTHRPGSGERTRVAEPLDALPKDIGSTDGFAVYRTIPTDEVVRREGRVLLTALDCVADLWPIYRLLLA